jgi:hypothetical protein
MGPGMRTVALGALTIALNEFGTQSVALTPEIVGLGPASVGIKESGSAVRAGLNLLLSPFPKQ